MKARPRNSVTGFSPLKWILVPAVTILLLAEFPHFLLANPSLPPADDYILGEYASFQETGDIRRFAGETLYIDISFLWFTNAASAKVGMYEKNGELYSVLEAETKGFVGFFTSYRKHYYKAVFDVVDGGRRVRSRRFERKVITGNHVSRTDHVFDYQNRTHSYFRYNNEELIDSGKENIPENRNFDDILAVFYNFRNSVYGKLEKDARFTIYTVPEKGVDKIKVHILNDTEANQIRIEDGRTNGEELLLKAIIPKEIFKTTTGELLFWGSKHYLPLETTVKDYILFGDLHAKLNSREHHPTAMAKRSDGNR